ncbi:redoxin domain-containing protein [Pseudonocardia hispaniensis]|uniref:Redoxin domain-containing protein n=1 Tax=Pseudonocardia hispaniensis TaxID=904933 RepID=A0ABW1J4C7_9PSEU
MDAEPAPELDVTEWLNSDPLTLAALRGRVVVLEAFQMLCPGCVSHSLPQAKRVAETFPADEVIVLGLHTVFEHHEAMRPVSLRAFVYENRLTFPIAIDRHDGPDPTPVTFSRYGMRGTPTTVLVDRAGRVRGQAFGSVPDLTLGAQVAALAAER